MSVSFPTSVTGVPSSAIPPAGIAANAFMRVDVTDSVQTFFSGMLSGTRTQTVRSFAVCGLVLAASPVPLILDPKTSDAPTLDLQGNPNINIVGRTAEKRPGELELRTMLSISREVHSRSESRRAQRNRTAISLCMVGPRQHRAASTRERTAIGMLPPPHSATHSRRFRPRAFPPMVLFPIKESLSAK